MLNFRPVTRAMVLGVFLTLPALASAQLGDDGVLQAREAYRMKDEASLTRLRDALLLERHPLAGWADHWLMLLRLKVATPEEVDQYLARWRNDYVADRLRNDWLLELGQRRDWATFLRIQPAFLMNDDRAVSCYGVLARQETSRSSLPDASLSSQAQQLWWGQKTVDQGCHAMAQGLLASQVLTERDVWRKIRLSYDGGQAQAASSAARLLDEATQQALSRAVAQPAAFIQTQAATEAGEGRYVTRTETGPDRWVKGKRRPGKSRVVREWVAPPPLPPARQAAALNVVAFQRWAANDPEAAAQTLAAFDPSVRWRMGKEDQAWVWASMGRWAASTLKAEPLRYFAQAYALGGAQAAATWAPDTLNWWARAAIRAAASGQGQAWSQLDAALDAMPADAQQETGWQYWRARSHLAQAAAGAAGDARRRLGTQILSRLAAQPVGFYNLLARDDLAGKAPAVPSRPVPLSATERAQARALPGLGRALRLYALDLRSEGAREWNYALSFSKPGAMSDRELLAAADWACEQQVWDRCINTSERTRQEIDWAQRFPTPFKSDILTAAQSVGLEPAYMFGLIRQESRFHASARSGVGASGLMQVMPATASWTARKLGLTDYTRDQLNDPEMNLRLGAGYLKLLIDEFAGSQAMAAAGYNAGPNRPRRWRNGPVLEAAAWAENIPFTETRDYVKKVLANAATYAHLLHGQPLTLRQRLGAIGPKTDLQTADTLDLP